MLPDEQIEATDAYQDDGYVFLDLGNPRVKKFLQAYEENKHMAMPKFQTLKMPRSFGILRQQPSQMHMIRPAVVHHQPFYVKPAGKIIGYRRVSQDGDIY